MRDCVYSFILVYSVNFTLSSSRIRKCSASLSQTTCLVPCVDAGKYNFTRVDKQLRISRTVYDINQKQAAYLILSPACFPRLISPLSVCGSGSLRESFGKVLMKVIKLAAEWAVDVLAEVLCCALFCSLVLYEANSYFVLLFDDEFHASCGLILIFCCLSFILRDLFHLPCMRLIFLASL